MTSPPAGLCETCRYARRIVSGKGSVFWLCRRAETDPAYPRYPALPVRTCAGYERLAPTPPDPSDPDRTMPPRTS